MAAGSARGDSPAGMRPGCGVVRESGWVCRTDPLPWPPGRSRHRRTSWRPACPCRCVLRRPGGQPQKLHFVLSSQGLHKWPGAFATAPQFLHVYVMVRTPLSIVGSFAEYLQVPNTSRNIVPNVEKSRRRRDLRGPVRPAFQWFFCSRPAIYCRNTLVSPSTLRRQRWNSIWSSTTASWSP